MNNEIKHLSNGDFEVMCKCGKPIHRYDVKGKFKYICPCGNVTEGRYEEECKIIDEMICQTLVNAPTKSAKKD